MSKQRYVIEVIAASREDAVNLLDDCEFNFRDDAVGGRILTVEEYLEKQNLRDIDDVGMCPKCFTRNTDDEKIYPPSYRPVYDDDIDVKHVITVRCVCNECGHQYEENPEQYHEYA